MTCVTRANALSKCGAAAAVALLLAGCATTLGQDFNLLSTRDEIELGERFAAEVEKKEKTLDDPRLQAYVAGVGARLAAYAPRQDVPYAFKVIDAPDTVNAFALPGGFCYVYTGLLTLCESEAELAAVMAHEIAHVAAYHHGETLTRELGFQLITSILLGENPKATAEFVADLLGTGVRARFSREQERQADELGMDMLFRAGYRPDAMLSLMYQLLAYKEQQGMVEPLPIFASHPPTNDRIARLGTLVQRYPAHIRMQNPIHAQRYHDEVLSRLNGPANKSR